MKVCREIVLPASREEVWESLTNAERLAEWFASEVELDARPGGSGVFRWANGEERTAVVETVEPERLFAFEWTSDEATSAVAFTLDDAPEGTRLTVVESATSAGPRASAAQTVPEWTWAIELVLVALGHPTLVA